MIPHLFAIYLLLAPIVNSNRVEQSPSQPNCDCYNKTSGCRAPLDPNWYADNSFPPGNNGFYLFVVQWLPAYCLTRKCNADTVRKIGAVKKDFKIHGLWPNFKPGVSGYPACCYYSNYDQKFNLNGSDIMRSLAVAANAPLLAALQTDWPDSSAQNYSLTLPVNKFFEYEYNKHGTCAMQFYKLDWMHQRNPYPTLDYISDAVEFLNKYNVLGFFGFNVPKAEQYLTDYLLGDYQQVKKILSFLTNDVAAANRFVFTCMNKTYLWEIRICADPKTKFTRPCPPEVLNVQPEARCDTTRPLFLSKWNKN